MAKLPGDEPVTPAGRLFIQPEMSTIIHGALGFKHQIDINSLKSAIKHSPMLTHPRFSSLLVHDKHGREHWHRTEIDIDRHVILASNVSKNNNVDKTVNDYIADLSVSTPLSLDKPLWEIHLMGEEKCLVFRVHHALGDGMSLMSMLLASSRKVEEDPEAGISYGSSSRPQDRKGMDWRGILMEFLKIVWFSLVFRLEFMLRCLWLRDRETVISGGDGVELWPRKVATAKFSMEDMILVKNAVGNSTINDVLVGVISAGLSRYLDHRSPNSMKEGQQITGISMVNLREQPGLQELSEMMKKNSESRWGNKFGMFLLPTNYHKGLKPLQYLKNAQKVTSMKKKTSEGHFSYKVGDLVMSWLGPKVATFCNYRIMCNTTFTLSNVMGPQYNITIAGNPIIFIRLCTSSLPQGLVMHMVSYAGKADLQIVVAKDIIADPEFLVQCFEDSLLEMKRDVEVNDLSMIH
ncbi:O-acyltransferase (WSD1-like) family protein [Euphorbia peplus]|nr:O-acyltransferase (WSD1-like) family protein [Euphorbia peplus]